MRRVGQMGIKRRKRKTEITPQSHWNQGRRVNSVRKHGPSLFLSLLLVISTFTGRILIMTWDRYQLAFYLPVNVSYFFPHKISLVMVQTVGPKLFNTVRVWECFFPPCLFQAALLHRRMKLLVLALSVALLFAAGQSATDSPLCKHNLCSCALGIFCSITLAFLPNLSHTQRHSGLLCHCLSNYSHSLGLLHCNTCVVFSFIYFLYFLSGEALNCHRCVPPLAGKSCELSLEPCKPEKDACAAVKFLREPCKFLNLHHHVTIKNSDKLVEVQRDPLV